MSAEPEDRLLEAVYFDTPDLRLLGEKVTLRRGAAVRTPVGISSFRPVLIVGKRCGCR